MTRRLTSIAILLTFIAIVATRALATNTESLIVHEWGTFTSIAGADGRAIEWLPLERPPDLPCFVNTLRLNLKGGLPSKVRMETPVLYFYAPHDVTVNVNVQFHRGVVTEWFPRAAVTPSSVDAPTLRRPDFSSSISWRGVKISPDASNDFFVDGSGSHYYVARQTDASPLQVGSQRERFLFYRGVGDFDPPIAATFDDDGRVSVESADGERADDAIVFRNDGGASDVPPPEVELAQMLVVHGLYSREAQAMIDTWRDTWFGEGTRLFYIVPRAAIDAILPLQIDPNPTEIVRVFVGRIELEGKRKASAVQRPAVTAAGCRR